MKFWKRYLEKLNRAPHVLPMLLKIEWARLNSRGIGGYVQFHAKNLRNRMSNGYPRALQIEPFGGCNLRCRMCFQGLVDLPADKTAMDVGLYRHIVDQMSPFTPMLYLYWRGEPLLHPQLGQMISYAKSRNMYVFVSTNGVTLNESRSKELIDAGLDFLMIGFDGATQETYSKMRPGAHFDEICAHVRTLVRLKRRCKSLRPHICLQFIVSRLNAHELSAARMLAQELGADSFLEKSLDIYTNLREERIERSLFPLVVQHTLSKYERHNGTLEFSGPSRCEMATRMVVRADGEISLCCYDMQGDYIVGSADDDDLLQLWRSPHYAILRRKGRNRELPLCSNCGAGVQK